MLQLTVRIRGHRLILEPTGIPLDLRDDAVCDVRVRPIDIMDERVSTVLARATSFDLLPAGTPLMSFVSTDVTSAHVRRGLRVLSPPGTSAAGYVEIILEAALHLVFTPPRNPSLADCTCRIPALGIRADSVNEAHTKISQVYEPRRRSHHGNVFLRVFFPTVLAKSDIWVPLDHLRSKALADYHAQTVNLLQSVNDSLPDTTPLISHKRPRRPRLTQTATQTPSVDVTILVQAMLAAQEAGALAADNEFMKLRARFGERGQYDAFAGACLNLEVAPRSPLGRQLIEVGETIPHVYRALRGSARTVIIALVGMTGRQEQCIRTAAEEAALTVLRDRLGIDGYVKAYES